MQHFLLFVMVVQNYCREGNPKGQKHMGKAQVFMLQHTFNILWWKHNIPYKPQWASQMSLQIRQFPDMQRLLSS